MSSLFTTPKLNEGGTELENILGCDFYKYVAPERGLVCRWLAAQPHAAAVGVIFSGQNFCPAQSQNCEVTNER
jgi:hypothetical protein